MFGVNNRSLKHKTAWMCPGQGSQSLAMLDWCQHEPLVLTCFEQVSEIAQRDLWQLLRHGPQTDIDDTQWTQPIMLAADVACGQLLKKYLPQPDFILGHSLGEWSALVLAEVLSLQEAAKAVIARAKAMKQAVATQKVMMLAVLGIEYPALHQLCQQISTAEDYQVNIANINAQQQIVVGGHQAAVEELQQQLLQQNVPKKCMIPLSVSVPAHTKLMTTTQNQLQQLWQNLTFQQTKIPIISNVNGTLIQNQKTYCELLLQQLVKPVLWSSSLDYLQQHHVDTVIEIGPGQVLTRLAKKCRYFSNALTAQQIYKQNTETELVTI